MRDYEKLIAALAIHVADEHDGELAVPVSAGMVEIDAQQVGGEMIVKASRREGSGIRLVRPIGTVH